MVLAHLRLYYMYIVVILTGLRGKWFVYIEYYVYVFTEVISNPQHMFLIIWVQCTCVLKIIAHARK